MMTPPPSPSPSQTTPSSSISTASTVFRATAGNALAMLVCVGVMGIVLALFAWPWRTVPPAGGAQLAHYAPLRDGDARLRLSYDRDEKPSHWTSESQAILSHVAALGNQLPRQTINAIFSRYQISAGSLAEVDRALRDVEIIEILQRTLTVDGDTQSLSVINLRDNEGEHLLSQYDTATNQERVFDPPLLQLPADLSAGHTWASKGYLSSGGISLTYILTGNVVGQETRATDFGSQTDCVRVDLELQLAQTESNAAGPSEPPLAHIQDQNWYCAGLGWVETQSNDLIQQQRTREVISKSSLVPSTAPLQLPNANTAQTAAPVQTEPAHLDQSIDQWELTRLGGLPHSGAENGDTIALTAVNGPQPMILAGLYSGELIAYNATTSLHEMLWRVHLGGPAYGQPAVDEARGRIYIGSSDKHLYAFDQRGLFLWAFATQDNVATTPVISDSLIIFGSEDRRVYALDADTGALRWQYETGGAVAASPILVGNKVVIGSDDGQVYALDAATGKAIWAVPTKSQVEAALVSDNDLIYAASRDGNVYALKAEDGQIVWQARSDQQGAFRNPPSLGAASLYVVDVNEVLYAFDRHTGQRLWRSANVRYVGRPSVLSAGTTEYIIMAQRDGLIEALSAEGQSIKKWRVTDALLQNNASATFSFGPLLGHLGNGADTVAVAWMLDNAGVMRMLAPPSAITRVLKPSFVRSALEDAFAFGTFDTAALPYQDQALVFDGQDRLHLINLKDGQEKTLGHLNLEATGAPNDPVIAGDMALIARKGTLTAVRLPDAAPVWQIATGNDRGLFSPTIIGDSVYWATSRLISSNSQTGTLQAIDLATGEVRWQFDVEGFLAIGNITGGDEGKIYLSSPAIAFDRETGEPAWQALFDSVQMLGGGALSANAQVLYVSSIDGNQSAIHAVNTRDGSELWRAPISGTVSFRSAIVLNDKGKQAQLLVKTSDGNVLGLSADTGKRIWQYQPRSKIAGQIALHQGRIWLIHEDSHVSVLDAASGKLVATFNDTLSDLSGRGGTWHASFMGNTALLPVGGRLIGIDLEGQTP